MFALSLTSINFHLSTVLVAFISQQGEEKIIHKNTHTLLLYIPMQLLLLELIYFFSLWIQIIVLCTFISPAGLPLLLHVGQVCY